MIVYVRTQGAKVVKEGRHLLVKKDGTVFNTLFTYKLKQLVLLGNVEITHRALVQLAREEVDVVFLSLDGRYLSRLAGAEARNVFLRRKQFLLAEDNTFGLDFARRVVAGKLANMATLLWRIKRSRGEKQAGVKAGMIQELAEPLKGAGNMEAIRGYEGRGSAVFFEGLRYGFTRDWGFRKRVRRPPTDPVNAVLSLLYTFLMNRVYAAVRLASLDPYVGFLHSFDYGRHSLVLDLMEEFRTIVADSLTLSLFNMKILGEADFRLDPTSKEGEAEGTAAEAADVTRDPLGRIGGPEESEVFDLPEQAVESETAAMRLSDGRHPVKLEPEAFKRVIEAFERKMTTRFHHPLAERQMTYQEAVVFQAAHFRQVVEGEAAFYQPLLLR